MNLQDLGARVNLALSMRLYHPKSLLHCTSVEDTASLFPRVWCGHRVLPSELLGSSATSTLLHHIGDSSSLLTLNRHLLSVGGTPGHATQSCIENPGFVADDSRSRQQPDGL